MAERDELPDGLADVLRLDDGDGPALPMSKQRQAFIADEVLAAWSAEVEGAATGARRRRWGGPVMVTAVVLAVGSAAALYVADFVRRGQPASDEGAPVSRLASAPTRPVEPVAATRPPEVQPDVMAKQEPSRPAAAGAQEDRLARANRLRGEGRYRAAERTYLQIVRGAPSSAAAYVARVAAADLRRERLDDPRGAIALYRQALLAPGSLSLEAYRGVAKAERALGRVSGERLALQTLLGAHPTGPAAAWARRRLAEMEKAVY